MADETTEEKPQENTTDAPETPAADVPAATKKGSSMLPWIVIAVVILVGAGAGLGMGLMFSGNGGTVDTVDQQQNQTSANKEPQANIPSASAINSWYFDMEPVVANLDEPGATRYVRAVLTLEMSGQITAEKGTALLEQKKPLLTNILTIYLSGLNIESTRGDKNLKRIQFEICDAFNERLFPDSKPLIKGILIKEFAVQ